MPKVKDVEQWTRNLANTLEANVVLVVAPEAGGLQVAFAGKPDGAVNMPPLLRHIADEMEKKNKMAVAMAKSGMIGGVAGGRLL